MTLSFIFPHVFTFIAEFKSSYVLELLSNILSFQTKRFSFVFPLRSIDNKLLVYCLSWNLLIFPSTLKGSFDGYRIFCFPEFFFFSTLNRSSHCLLTIPLSSYLLTRNQLIILLRFSCM